MTTTDVAVHGALAIDPSQTTFTREQRGALATLGDGVRDAPEVYQRVFLHVCQRTGLDPFARQIHMIERQGRYTIQTGIDGYRLVARRAADRAHETLSYEDPQWCGEDGVWRDVWLSKEPPAAARVVVIRDGQRFPFVAVWDEYVQRKGNGQVNSMWSTMQSNQLRKCAEAGALRMAFPQDLSGVYIDEEMDRDLHHEREATARKSGTDAVRAAIKSDADEVIEAEVIQDDTTSDATPTSNVESDTWITDEQRAAISDYQTQIGLSKSALIVIIRRATGGTAKTLDELTAQQASAVLDELHRKMEN